MLGGADNDRPSASKGNTAGNAFHIAVFGGSPLCVHGGNTLDIVAVCRRFPDEIRVGKIYAGPPSHQCQRPGFARIVPILFGLCPRMGIGCASNHGCQRKDFDVRGRSPCFDGKLAQIGDTLGHAASVMPDHKDAFGMTRRKGCAFRRRPRLIEHRRPLWRRLAKMDSIDPEIFALMDNTVDLRRIRKHAVLPIFASGTILPAAFPEIILDRDEFLRNVIADIMRDLFPLACPLRTAVKIASHDVPADPPVRHMVKRRHASRKGQRCFVRKIDRDRKGKMLGCCRHRRNDQQGIIGGNLHRLAQCGIRASTINVVNPNHIGKKQAIKLAAFQRAREFNPMVGVLVIRGFVARMTPHPL